MLHTKVLQEAIVGKQGMFTIGNQQHWFDLRCVGIQFTALMAEQCIDRPLLRQFSAT